MKPVISQWVRAFAAVAALLFLTLLSAAQTAPVSKGVAPGGEARPRIDPKATDLLKKMSDYLGSARAFTVRVSFSQEVVLLTGQKIEYESWSHLSLRRPNRFRAVRHGVLENLDFYYDGKTMTLFQRGPNFYAVEPAPP